MRKILNAGPNNKPNCRRDIIRENTLVLSSSVVLLEIIPNIEDADPDPTPDNNRAPKIIPGVDPKKYNKFPSKQKYQIRQIILCKY